MRDLLKLFTRSVPQDPSSTQFRDHQDIPSLKDGYAAAIQRLLDDMRIERGCVSIEVRYVGLTKDKLPLLLGMLRVRAWHSPSVARLLLGQPLLERRMAHVLRTSWLRDVSCFGGLWIHSPARLLERDVLREWRDVHTALEAFHDSRRGSLERH